MTMNAGNPVDQDPSITHSHAWLAWFSAVLLAAVFLLAAVGVTGLQMTPKRPLAGVLATAVATLWLILAVPGAMLLRSHILKRQMAGLAIEGSRYVKGMATVWGATAIGGGLAGLACMIGGGLMPGGVPWLIAIMTLIALSPAQARICADITTS